MSLTEAFEKRPSLVSADNGDQGLHPAAPFVAAFIAVAVGRLPEIVPILQPLMLGKLTIVVAVLAVMFSKHKTNAIFDSPLGIRVVLFAALAVASLSFSVWTSRTLVFLELDMLRIFLIFTLVYKTTVNSKTILFYVYVVVAILLLMAVVGLQDQAGSRVRFSNTYDPNDIGLVVLTSSAFVYGISRDKNIRFWKSLLVLSIVGFAVVLSTQSRGAFLGLCAVGVFFLLAKENPGEGKYYGLPSTRILLATGFGVFAVLMITPEESWNRILTVFELSSDYNSSAERGRMAIWERGFDAFLSRPWGVGGGAYQAADGRAGGSFMTAHNSFLQVLVELGLVGIILYVGFYRKIWQYSSALLLVKGRDGEGFISPNAFGFAIRGAIIGYLVSSFFLSMAYGRLFYVLLALAAAAERVWIASPISQTSKIGIGSKKSG